MGNSGFRGSGYRPDELSELGRRQEPMFREEVGPELARVGDGARLLVVGRWFSGCCRRLLSGHLGSEWKGHKQGEDQTMRQCKIGFAVLLPSTRHGQGACSQALNKSATHPVKHLIFQLSPPCETSNIPVIHISSYQFVKK